jgi:hypothetical protein
MKRWIIAVLALSILLCMAACDQTPEVSETSEPPITEAPTETPATEETTTEAPATEAPATEAPTTEEPATEEETTQAKEEIYHPTVEEVAAYATTVLATEDILAAAHNPEQDWSDFGGLTLNEDGSLTALFRYGTDNVWDPYFYLIRQDTPVDDIMVIKYRSEYAQGLNLYMGTEGNVAHGGGDNVDHSIKATNGDWAYALIDMSEVAYCYDPSAGYLGYLRFGLANTAEDGDTVDIGFVAFFPSMDEVDMVIPY